MPARMRLAISGSVCGPQRRQNLNMATIQDSTTDHELRAGLSHALNLYLDRSRPSQCTMMKNKSRRPMRLPR